MMNPLFRAGIQTMWYLKYMRFGLKVVKCATHDTVVLLMRDCFLCCDM